MRRFLVRTIALVSLLACSSRGDKMSIQSSWAAAPVVIDGKVSEWQFLIKL